MTAVDEQALRAELEQVRAQVVGLWQDGDAATGREYLATVVGSLALPAAALLTGIVVTNVGEEPAGALAAVSVLALLLWCVTVRAFRSPVRRRVHIYREVRRLRRRERELAGLLPAGSAGANSYRRYYGQRFGNPATVVLYAALFVVLLLVLLS